MKNKGCLNALWHFPFLGFLFAFMYLIAGAVACCTIIFIPVGLSYFQISKFMMSPFSHEMVSRKDLMLFNPELKKTSIILTVLGVVDKILYIPFGIIVAGMSFFQMLACFVSIIGIPLGVVYWKMLPTFFNPVEKVCVPKEVADEIQKIKSSNALGDYKAQHGIADNNVSE